MDHAYDFVLFVSAVRKGSFAAAAAEHRLTASAVSKRITQLEARLRRQLLKRSTRNLELTEAGEQFLEGATRLVEELAAVEHSVRHLSTMPEGQVNVSSHTAFAELHLLPVLPEFLTRHPKVSINLMVGDHVETAERDQADLIIRSASSALPHYAGRKLFPNPWVLCATPAYLRTAGVPAHPRDLVRHNCLNSGPHGLTRDRWMFQIERQIEAVEVSGCFGGFGRGVYEMVKAHLGIGRLPAFLVKQDLAHGTLVSVLSGFLVDDARAMYLFYREQRPPALAALIDFLTERLAEPARPALPQSIEAPDARTTAPISL